MNILLSKKMRYFICLMETCCINTAAEKLCITRSPLGKILTELEDFIGKPLFMRRYNILEPTTTALSLYEKIKPLYESICTIENEFSHKLTLKKFDIIFDNRMPASSIRHLMYKIKINKIQVNCKVISCYDNISSASLNANTMYLTNRVLENTENLREINVGQEAIIMMVPKDECCDDNNIIFNDKKMTLLIRADDISKNSINAIIKIVKNKLPNINVEMCDALLPELMLQASAGNTIVVLPEYLSSFIECNQLRKIKIADIMIDKKLYVRKDFKNEKLINQIIQEFSI